MGRAGSDDPLLPQAHIYSLGATLKAALEYVAEPELEPRLSPELEALLSQMQAEDPRDRPDLEVSAQPGTGATLELRHGPSQEGRLLPETSLTWRHTHVHRAS